MYTMIIWIVGEQSKENKRNRGKKVKMGESQIVSVKELREFLKIVM